MLAPHPADITTKLEAFTMLSGITALFAQHELAGGAAVRQRNAAYLHHALTSGEHPRLAQALSQAPPATVGTADRFHDILARILTGRLGPAPG